MNNIPSIPSSPNISSGKNVAGSGAEKASERVVAKSRGIKIAVNNVTTTRASFKVFLRQFDIDLLTSLILIRENGDFIKSSFVIYLKNNNYTEPLEVFLQRYPQYLEPVTQIANTIKTLNYRDLSESGLQNL